MSQSTNAIDTLLYATLEFAYRLLPYRVIDADASASRRILKFYIWAHVFALRFTAKFGNGRLRNLQRKRFKKLLRSVNSPTHKGISDFSISTREDIANQSASQRRMPARTVIERRTSGTTGMPLRLFLDKKTYYIQAAAYYVRMLEWFGVDLISLMPGKFFITLNYANSPGTMFYPFFRSNISADFSSSALKEEMAKAFQMITEGGKTLMFGYPSDVLIFAQQAEEAKVSLPFIGIMLTGQKMEREVREYVERALGCPVISYYGNQEAGLLAAPCLKSSEQFHVMSERIIMEIIDKEGNKVLPGETGDIALTCLDFRLLPIIRYQTGDRGRMPASLCDCGISLPLLELEGREIEYIHLPDGASVPERSLRTIFLGESYIRRIRQFQVRQDSLNELFVTIVPASQWLLRDTNELTRVLESALSNKMRIHVDAVTKIDASGGKFKSFIPLREGARPQGGSVPPRQSMHHE